VPQPRRHRETGTRIEENPEKEVLLLHQGETEAPADLMRKGLAQRLAVGLAKQKWPGENSP